MCKSSLHQLVPNSTSQNSFSYGTQNSPFLCLFPAKSLIEHDKARNIKRILKYISAEPDNKGGITVQYKPSEVHACTKAEELYSCWPSDMISINCQTIEVGGHWNRLLCLPWQPDSSSPMCTRCHKPFTITKRVRILIQWNHKRNGSHVHSHWATHFNKCVSSLINYIILINQHLPTEAPLQAMWTTFLCQMQQLQVLLWTTLPQVHVCMEHVNIYMYMAKCPFYIFLTIILIAIYVACFIQSCAATRHRCCKQCASERHARACVWALPGYAAVLHVHPPTLSIALSLSSLSLSLTHTHIHTSTEHHGTEMIRDAHL